AHQHAIAENVSEQGRASWRGVLRTAVRHTVTKPFLPAAASCCLKGATRCAECSRRSTPRQPDPHRATRGTPQRLRRECRPLQCVHVPHREPFDGRGVEYECMRRRLPPHYQRITTAHFRGTLACDADATGPAAAAGLRGS